MTTTDIGYWLVYPTWPLISSSTQGLFNWHSREAVTLDLEALKTQRGPMVGKLGQASLQEIAADPLLSEFARAQGRSAFVENCAPCHGDQLVSTGQIPNLQRLTPADRAKFDSTVRDGRNQMPPWRGVVSDEQTDQIWAYIRSISDR